MRYSFSRSSKNPTTGPVGHDYPAKAKLFDIDRAPRQVYLLRSGTVQLARGHESIVDYLSPGDFFGEQCLLGPSQSSQIAVSLSPVHVDVFKTSKLLDLVQKDRRFAMRLLKNLTHRLNRYEEMIRDSVADPAERRLARLLFRFVPAHASSDWVQLLFSPNNSELAKTIGTTRWRVAHFMHHFQQLGWLGRRPELWVRPEGIREFLQSMAGGTKLQKQLAASAKLSV
jgi:CRP/FNR family transcriptional regulator, cyclic AMP receptor protein